MWRWHPPRKVYARSTTDRCCWDGWTKKKAALWPTRERRPNAGERPPADRAALCPLSLPGDYADRTWVVKGSLHRAKIRRALDNPRPIREDSLIEGKGGSWDSLPLR